MGEGLKQFMTLSLPIHRHSEAGLPAPRRLPKWLAQVGSLGVKKERDALVLDTFVLQFGVVGALC